MSAIVVGMLADEVDAARCEKGLLGLTMVYIGKGLFQFFDIHILYFLQGLKTGVPRGHSRLVCVDAAGVYLKYSTPLSNMSWSSLP